MKILSKLACLSLAALMVACAPAGYYDSNGVYRAYGKSDTSRYNKPMAGTGTEATTRPPAPTTIVYTRPGYYDYNGYFIPANAGPTVSSDYFPPRGLCRIWFSDRMIDDQPAVESCSGIQSRVPAGAYVIYGG